MAIEGMKLTSFYAAPVCSVSRAQLLSGSCGPRLYNLDQEIGEQTNVAEQHPEIVTKLSALAERMKANLGKPNAPGSRPAGKVENPQPLYPSEGPQREKPAAKK